MISSLLSIGLLGASLISGNINSQNAYVPLDQSYFEIYRSDVTSGSYHDIDFGSLQSFNVNISPTTNNLTYTINGNTTTSNINKLSFNSVTGEIGINRNFTDTIPFIKINFYTNTFDYLNGDSGTLEYIKIGEFAQTLGQGNEQAIQLYDIIADYLFDSQSIIISSFNLQNRVFTNLANYTNGLSDSDLAKIYCKCPQILVANEYVPAERSSFQITDCMLFYDDYINVSDGNIFLVNVSTNNYYGLWGYNAQLDVSDGSYSIPYDIEIVILDRDIYNYFIYYLDMDINGYNRIYGAESFAFIGQFNYNAPYNTDVNSSLIYDSYFTDHYNDTPTVDYRIELPLFKSNNQIFKAIVLTYSNAYGKYYMSDTYTYPIISGTNGYGYFSKMSFVKSDNSGWVTVCEREFNNWVFEGGNGNNTTQQYIYNNVKWVNPSYMRLQFLSYTSNAQKDALGSFNQGLNGVVGGGTIDLNGTFELIDSGFTGLAGLLSITLLPGISIGMLAMIPFAITLLLFVLRLFKR